MTPEGPEPAQTTSSDLQRRAFEAADQIGDLTFAPYTSANLTSDRLFAGDPLGDGLARSLCA